MDTSEFRKPRPDFPIVPQSAILRPRVQGFRVPRGRRGRKPRGRTKTPQQPQAPPIPDRYKEAKTQEIRDNARDRRERLRLEQEISRETIRYRERKAEREAQAQAVRTLEGRRSQQLQDRLIQDQARHFTALLERGERRAGELQAQYQEFVRQMISVRNLPEPDVEIKFAPAGGSLFEEVEEEEEVGGLRKPEVVRPSQAVVQSFQGAGVSLVQELQEAEAQSPPAGTQTLDEIAGLTPRKTPTPRERAEAQAKKREEAQRKVQALLQPQQQTPEPEPVLEQETPVAKAKKKAEKQAKKLGKKLKKEKAKEEQEAEERRLFLTTAPALYDAQQKGKTQTKEQIELSDEYLSVIGAKDKQVSFDTLKQSFKDTPQQMAQADKDVYVRINERFSKAGAGKQAGIFKVRQLPPRRDAEIEDQRYQKFVFSDPFGREDIATLNPRREVGGVNEFDKAVAEGKIQFFVVDKEQEAQP